MDLVYITTNDPLYLPAFFDRVLAHDQDRTLAVFVAPPLSKNESLVAAVRKYLRTFGWLDLIGLVWRVGLAKLKKQSIASACKQNGIRYSEISDVNAPEFLAELKELAPELIISVSCPQIFKSPLIALPPRGVLKLHGAILPQYRGVMPSFWMMANDEIQAGVSIYFMNEKIDAGDLCGQRIFDIHHHESLDSFVRRSKKIAADLLFDTLRRMKKNKIIRRPLDLKTGSYHSWPDRNAVKRFRDFGRSVW